MCRKALLVAILGLCVVALGAGPGLSEERNRGTMGITLTFLERHKIEDEAQGLKEPSGLALTPARDGLWTVSDDTGKVFRLDLQGRLDASGSFAVPLEGLEGITLDGGGGHLVVVKEEDREDGRDEPDEIIRIGIEARAIVERRRLDELAGYDAVARHFEGGEENKGLEGIAWNPDSGSFFLLKEGEPGLLLEVSADLRSLLSHRVLSWSNGFRDDDRSSEKIDYSGLVYDASRAAFWIVSDKARRLFLYDPTADAVLQHTALGYVKDGEYREIEKSEGVAFDHEAGRLYVVSDEDARLYVFDLRG